MQVNKLGWYEKDYKDATTTKSADLVKKVSSLVELKTFDDIKQGFNK